MEIKRVNPHVYTYEKYVRIGNKHIFLGLGFPLDDGFDYIPHDRNQIVHVFLIDPCQIDEYLRQLIVEESPYLRKLVVHVPKRMRDIMVVLKHIYPKLPPRVYFTLDSKGPEFACWPVKIKVNYEMEPLVRVSVSTTISYNFTYRYDLNDKVYANVAQWEFPEIFKDVLIQRFKEVTPIKIAETFKSDDDIWEFIMDERHPERTKESTKKWYVATEKKDVMKDAMKAYNSLTKRIGGNE